MILAALLLLGGLFGPLMAPCVQGVQNPNLTTVNIANLAPAFTAPARTNVTILTFTLSDSANWEEFTGAVVNYTGNSTADVKVARLFRESAGSGGTFNSSTDTLLATNSSIAGNLIVLSLSSWIQRNRATQFYVVFDISDNAADSHIVDARIDIDALTIGGRTWPNVTYDPSEASKIDSSPPSGWADFWPGGWQPSRNPDCLVAVNDSASGLAVQTAQYRYSTDGGGNWSSWLNASCSGANGTTSAQNITAQGVPFGQDSGTDNLIQFRIKDMMGNSGTSPNYIVKIDSVAPVGWALISPVGWYTFDRRPDVSVTVRDNLSGLSNITLSAELTRNGGATWSPVPSVNSTGPAGQNMTTLTARTAPFDNDSASQNLIRFNSSDVAGNWNVSPPYVIKIDSTPPGAPSIVPKPPFTNGTTNNVSWNASPDPVSGLSWYKVRCDDDPGFSSPLSTVEVANATLYQFSNLTDGVKYYYEAASIDRAGHQSNWSAPANSTQDASPPVTNLSTSPPAPFGASGWFANRAILFFNASDNSSGVAATRFSVDSGGVVKGNSTEVVDEGEHAVRFWSEDNVGNREAVRTAVIRIDRTPPIAIMRSPTTVYANETADFDGSASIDGEQYSWDFGDGSAPAAGIKVNHVYAFPGLYTVSLTVSDRAGLTCTTRKDTKVFSRGVNYPPTAVIGPLPTLYSDVQVTFDGSQSTDEEPSTLRYEWDFGDNSSGSGAQTVHSYISAGIYIVKLKVTDSAGLYDIASREIRVYVRGENHPPLAHLDQRNVAYAGEPLILDATNSSDEDPANLTYRWDFGDGSTGTGVVVSHVYVTESIYLVRLNLTDTGGLTGSAELAIRVFLRGTNLPPSAQFTFFPSNPKTGRPVEFDASLSMDEDPFTLNFSWDFGDGAGAQGKIARHSFANKGTYEVKLRVRDRGGLTDTYSYFINIEGVGKPMPPQDNGWLLWTGAAIIAAGILVPLAFLAASRRKKRPGPAPGRDQPSHAVEGPVSLISPIPSGEAPPAIVVEKGLNYLLDAGRPALAYDALGKLTSEGAKGLLLTPVHPKKLQRMGEVRNTEVVWLSEMTGDEPSLDPGKMEHEMLEKVLEFIKANREEGVVLIDGLELLIERHGFEKVLEFVQGVNEVASVNEATVLANAHSKAMKEVEFNQLKRKFDRW